MDLALTIPGGPPRKNAKHKLFAKPAGRGRYTVGRTLSDEYKRFVERVELAWDRERSRGAEKIVHGVWGCVITAAWARWRHLDLSVGGGDVDAPIECALDALQAAGVIDDDARIVELKAVKMYGGNDPRLHIHLYQLDPKAVASHVAR